MSEARTVIDKAMTEDELLQAIVEAALFLGWRVHHDRRSDRALQQGTPGFPDLVLAKAGRVPRFVELKADKGLLTEAQLGWMLAVGGRVIRPADLDDFLEELAR